LEEEEREKSKETQEKRMKDLVFFRKKLTRVSAIIGFSLSLIFFVGFYALEAIHSLKSLFASVQTSLSIFRLLSTLVIVIFAIFIGYKRLAKREYKLNLVFVLVELIIVYEAIILFISRMIYDVKALSDLTNLLLILGLLSFMTLSSVTEFVSKYLEEK
jgi:hypothetical protein